jgi:hypothetical protein
MTFRLCGFVRSRDATRRSETVCLAFGSRREDGSCVTQVRWHRRFTNKRSAVSRALGAVSVTFTDDRAAQEPAVSIERVDQDAALDWPGGRIALSF